MKILCYGDSNTYGYDPRGFFGSRYPADQRWVDLLARKLNRDACNAGQNGREIPKKEREFQAFQQLLTRQMPVDLLILMLGTNDLLQGNSAAVTACRMEVFLKQIDLEKSRILLIGPPPMQRGQWVPNHALVDASMTLTREYKALADRLGIRFADAEEWKIPLAFDGVHFTEEGHRAFAEGLANYLNKGE